MMSRCPDEIVYVSPFVLEVRASAARFCNPAPWQPCLQIHEKAVISFRILGMHSGRRTYRSRPPILLLAGSANREHRVPSGGPDRHSPPNHEASAGLL